MERNAEFKYLVSFVYEVYLTEKLARDQFRSLWTAYCFHHNLDTDTVEYDKELQHLWSIMSEVGDGTMVWSNYEIFDHFMSRYLV